MTKARGRVRRERRLKEVSGAPDVPIEEPDELDEECWEQPVFPTEKDRIVLRIVQIRGALVDFAMEHCHLRNGSIWVPVIRIDSCHGRVHVHRFNRSGDEFANVDICDNTEIDEGYEKANDLIWDQMEENLRRWRSGR